MGKQTTPSQPDAAPAPARPPLQALINTHDFVAAAEATYSPKAWAFLSSAATDLHTKRRNASAYADITLRPRVLRDVSAVSTSATVLGRRVRAPIFCSPTSLGRLFHRDGEKALGRACARLGVPQCVSTSASFPLPDIVAAVREAAAAAAAGRDDVPVFFQLYVDKNRARSAALLAEAAALGVAAVFLTVDAPVAGKREADERAAPSPRDARSLRTPMAPAASGNGGGGGGGAIGRIMGSYVDASVSWRDLAWLRAACPGVPLVLKGVQTAADAVAAADAGVDAILVSNHGGRSVDTAPAPICVLLELHRCCPDVFRRLEVYVDGGISRGTDVFKALCLGARAVGLGRGVLYGLAYGEEGVQRYVEILIDELETTMKLCGVTSVDQLHPGLVNTLALDPLIPSSMDGHPYAKWPSEPRNSKL
ncbi:hypothetical protein RB595_002794 [Gaeumannomyces hyphopodioides]